MPWPAVGRQPDKAGWYPFLIVAKPPVEPSNMHPERREALLKEYGEVASNFRTLTDIRFRLLTLLPIAAAATAAFKTDALSPGRLPLSLFGLAATIGLVTYNARNDQLYDALVGRAADIERSLRLQDGSFANRPTPWFSFCVGRWRWKVNHRLAIATLYVATVAFWLFMALDTVLAHAWQGLVAPPTSRLVAMLGALLLTFWAGRTVKQQVDCRTKELRKTVCDAVGQLIAKEAEVLKARALAPPLTENDPALPHEDAAIMRAIADDGEFLTLCVRILSGKEGSEENGKVRAKALFYSGLGSDAIRYYVPQSSA